MVDLILPRGRQYKGWEANPHLAPQAPLSIRQGTQASAATHAQIDEAVYRMGPEAMPKGPLALFGPDGRMMTIILTDGVTPMIELAEVAHQALDAQESRVNATGHGFDFDAARERAGMVRRENVGAAAAEAIQDRIRKHQANPVTDPPRQPLRWSKNY